MANEERELKLAIAQLELLLEEKEQLEVKIAKQRQRVAAWEILANNDDGRSPNSPTSLDSILDREGLTDACSTVLRASTKEWMTTAEIQVALREFGFDLGKYKAPHASIMTTVNRLAEGPNSEVVVRRSSTPGGTEYRWVGSRFSAAARKRYGAGNSLASQMADGRIPIGPSTAKLLAIRNAQKKKSEKD
jgi:hypothetical protein